MARVCVVVALVLAMSVCGAWAERVVTAYVDANRHWSLREGVAAAAAEGAAATAKWADTLNTTGWGELSVWTQSTATDLDQFYGAGFVEGSATAQRIWEEAYNIKTMFWSQKPFPPKIGAFFDAQEAWVYTMIKQNPTDLTWMHIALLMSQYEGLIAGYQATAPANQSLVRRDFQILNGVGDLLDLNNVAGPRPDWMHMTPEELAAATNARSMCSAIIKITGDYSDLFGSHSAWFSYSAINRIYKHYSFAINTTPTSAKKMSFSSYPGMLESLDDFYMMDNNIVMIQTTNSIYNTTLYDLVVPESLFAWQRVRIANLMAHNGPEWSAVVTKYNSGTYNNQYMVVDYNKFRPGQPLPDNTLWVVEQIPGLVVGADTTQELRRGYFPSYNVPYFVEIFNKSGYPDVVKKYGPDYSYELAPRAKIFRRDEAKVVDLATLKHLMRQNDFQTDPYSKGDPWSAICSRGDLAPSGSPSGCYDTKVTQSSWVSSLRSDAVNGPTTQNQKPFSWTQFPTKPHMGLPDTFNFDFAPMQPRYPL